MLNIAICEDDDFDRNTLEDMLRRYCSESACYAQISAFSGGEQLLDGCEPGDYKIMILDVSMQGMTGLELADRIRQSGDDCRIVFTAVSPEHAVEGFRHDASHYMLKPFGYADIRCAMERCVAELGESARYINVMSNRIQMKILHKDIIYVEIYNTTCLIHTVNGCVKTYSALDNIEKDIGEDRAFLRCHRSYIVNMSYIGKLDRDVFLMKDGGRVPIRKSRLLATKQSYTDFLFHTTAPQLQDVLLPSFDEAKQIKLDFAKLAYISSAGLRVLLIGEKTPKPKAAL